MKLHLFKFICFFLCQKFSLAAILTIQGKYNKKDQIFNLHTRENFMICVNSKLFPLLKHPYDLFKAIMRVEYIVKELA